MNGFQTFPGRRRALNDRTQEIRSKVKEVLQFCEQADTLYSTLDFKCRKFPVPILLPVQVISC
jgi:hypothetical protein